MDLPVRTQEFKHIRKRADINKSKTQKPLYFVRHYDPHIPDENYQSNIEIIQNIAKLFNILIFFEITY